MERKETEYKKTPNLYIGLDIVLLIRLLKGIGRVTCLATYLFNFLPDTSGIV